MNPLVAMALLVLLPGILGWWWHRGLRRAGDPSMLAERVAAINRRVAFATSALAAFAVVSAGWYGLLTVPLMLVGVAAASYRTRRILFGETWPFHRYLAWRARIVCGAAGFFLLLAATPALVAAAPDGARLPLAATLLVVLAAWHHGYGRVLLRIVGASPLGRPDLEPVLASVLQRATAPMPKVWHAGPAGGVIANALALPGLPTGNVLFFDTLLERLTPSEIGAIFAHEVAHLEHFNARRMRVAYAAGVFAVVVAVALSLAAAGASSTFDRWYPRLWPLLVFAGLMARATRMQAHETESDLRAVQLCGDAEALVSALTRLHAIHHVPRRWAASVEEHATHPSLARRIRAIRGASRETPPRRLEAPLLVASREPGGHVLFDRDRLTLAWGTPAAAADPVASATRLEATAYEELCELRVDSTAAGAMLVARARHGKSWSIPLGEHDVARVQAALDTVDQLLAPPLPARQFGARRIAALLAIAAGATLSSLFAVLMPAMLAVLRPTRPAAAALAAGLVGAALGADNDSILGSIRALVFASLAALALWLARTRTAGEDGRLPHVPGWVESLWLGLPLAAGAIWIVAGNRHDLFGLHTTARDGAWLAASAAALTGYLAVSSIRRYRSLSAGAAVLAVIVLWFGSSSFLTAVVRDPLAVDMPFLTMRTERLAHIGAASVSGRFSRVRVTRDGRYFLLSEYEAEDHAEDEEPQRHVVGALDGWSRAFEAAEAAFIDDGRLLIVEREPGAARLRAEGVRDGAAAWSTSLPGVEAHDLRTGPGGQWEVVHRNRDGFLRVAGTVGASFVERTQSAVETTPEEYVVQHLDDGSGRALAVTSSWNGPLFRWLAFGWRSRTALLQVGPSGTSRLATTNLAVRCTEPSMGSGRVLCVAFDGRLSRFWEYDPDKPGFEARGQTRGMVFSVVHDSGRTFSAALMNGPALVNLDAGEVVTFESPDGRPDFAIPTSSGYVAAATIQGDRTAVTMYRRAAGPVSTR